jgi:hypothetical protein
MSPIPLFSGDLRTWPRKLRSQVVSAQAERRMRIPFGRIAFDGSPTLQPPDFPGRTAGQNCYTMLSRRRPQ